MIVIEPRLGLISLAPVPFVVLISYRYGRRARPAIQETQQRIAELTADAEENISGVRVVKAFAREPRQLQRFQGSVGRVFSQAMVATRLEAKYNPMIGFLPQLGLAAVLLIGGNAVIHAHLTLGQFTAFYLYLNMLIAPMRTLGVILNLAQRATASGARLFQVLDRPPRLTDRPAPRRCRPATGTCSCRASRCATTTPTSSARRLGDTGEQQRHAPARPNGPPAQRRARGAERHRPGRARRAHGRARRRHRLGQDQPRLADLAAVRRQRRARAARRRRRARGGPALAAPGRRGRQRRPVPVLRRPSPRTSPTRTRTATREAIEQAARRAQAHEFIERLPDGYDTRVGERGLTLSGGQRQRLAIARALLADPRVLILDDATSSVDASTERQIKLALDEAMAGRTTFIDRPPPLHDRAGG